MFDIKFLIGFLVLISFNSKGQEVTYFSRIKSIIDKNCLSCHRPSGAGPFSFESYDEVKANAQMIKHVVNSRYMPPWMADTTFQQHKNQRVLSERDIKALSLWIDEGAKKGKQKKEKKKQTKGLDLKNVDVSVSMNRAYKIPSNNIDDFRFFYKKPSLTKELYVSKIEFVPGNRKQVHHSRIMIDTTGKIDGINGLSENDPAVYKYQTSPLQNEFFYGWVPGNFPFEFPNNAAIILPKTSNFIFNMHYAPNVLENNSDSSTVRLYLLEKPPLYEIKTLIMRENNISNQPFEIPAGETKTFYMSSGPLQSELDLISVQPHAHQLCKNFKAFAITPDGDLIPFVKIDEWDFNWQETYYFRETLKVPKGSVIIAEASYDNTSTNLSNPFNPPKDAGYGWRTTDEMMNLIFNYMVLRSK